MHLAQRLHCNYIVVMGLRHRHIQFLEVINTCIIYYLIALSVLKIKLVLCTKKVCCIYFLQGLETDMWMNSQRITYIIMITHLLNAGFSDNRFCQIWLKANGNVSGVCKTYIITCQLLYTLHCCSAESTQKVSM